MVCPIGHSVDGYQRVPLCVGSGGCVCQGHLNGIDVPGAAAVGLRLGLPLTGRAPQVAVMTEVIREAPDSNSAGNSHVYRLYASER